MKKFGLGLVLTAAAALVMAADMGSVTADILNVRQGPSVKSPVMFRLRKGDRVRVTATDDKNWMEIELTENAPVYVSEAYVVGGKALRDLKMFAGKGSKTPVWGELKKGEEVKLIDDRGYGWVRIAPPERLRAYVLGVFIKLDDASEAKPEAKAEVKSETKPEAKPEVKQETKPEVKPEAKPEAKPEVKPEAKPEAKPEVKPEAKPAAKPAPAVPDETMIKMGIEKDAPGKAFERTGTLARVSSSKLRTTDFALIDVINSSNIGFIYAPGQEKKLQALDGRIVRISGTAFRIKNWKAPVVLVRSIREN